MVLVYEICDVKVENEYGSYGLQTKRCDKEYLRNLRDIIYNLVGDNVVLFTTDGNREEESKYFLTNM